MNFSSKFGSASTIWYPASGYRHYRDGSLFNVGNIGFYWSASPYSYNAYYLYFYGHGYVYPSSYYYRAVTLSVASRNKDLSASLEMTLLGGRDTRSFTPLRSVQDDRVMFRMTGSASQTMRFDV